MNILAGTKDVIEAQLAHSVSDSPRGEYNTYAEFKNNVARSFAGLG
jgi:hypothetical protein